MNEKKLEFRGIKLEHLIEYFIELGGKQISTTFPFVFETNTWKAEIIKEEEVTITSTFIVNAVHVLFKADNENELNKLIANYRKKTTRIGG
ncbi:hypothetical protein [Bacillus sp. Marseille-P3661]|uniref:hypothetical protein n=1 Tax=Bacillus sp. Marseille-P3661 TaxID=1936234 RepID=UPI000C8585E6|nr:hypothetical protein [Bacillus sp. Marseille-P3661]